MIKLSVIIVTYNSEKDIFDCLQSLYANNDLNEGELEVIVVDNNSAQHEEMFTKIHSLYQNVRTIKNNQNGGYGQGNNVGIRQAKAPLILIMNPDVRLTTPCFQKVTRAFEQDDRLSMYGMRQILDDGTPSRNSFCCTGFVNGYFATLLTVFCNRFNLYLPSLLYFSGACFFVRKSHFTKAGLFDENIFMYGEENDIHHRLKALFGAHFRYDKDMAYMHLTQERKSDMAYEDKKLFSTIRICEKFGYPRNKTIRNKIQNINLLILKESIRKMLSRNCQDTNLPMLQQYRSHLKELIKEEA